MPMSKSDSKYWVMLELAYARYEDLISDPRTHKHFMSFIYAVVKEEVIDIVHFSSCNDDEPITKEEAFRYFLFTELPCSHKSLRDFICQRYENRYYPAYSDAPIFSYRPDYDYTESH